MADVTDPAIDDPNRIDSLCGANPLDADGPTEERCGQDAITYVFRPQGHRIYLCTDHARHVIRFDDDVFGGDVHPTVVVCDRCLRPTPKKRVNHDHICEDCQVDG